MEWTGLIIAAVALVAATGFGLFRRARQGTVRPVTTVDPATVDPHQAVLAGLGVRPGTVTLLQFSSAFCAPCRATRVVCADLAASTDGLTHVEIDAESHLDEVRALDIWRTPTVLIIDAEGRIVGRAQGAPNRAQVLNAVVPLLSAGTTHPEMSAA